MLDKLDWITTLSLIFGGCCSNALTLEQITSQYPDFGTLITFFQFLLVSLVGLPKHVTFRGGYPTLRPRTTPLLPYMIQVALFFAISIINNAAFGYQVPMTVHILFRSAGLLVSMVLGMFIAKKRYSITQTFAVLLVSIGVAITTLSASRTSSSGTSATAGSYASGIGLLSIALLLSGFLGLIQDWTRMHYNNAPGKDKSSTWQESAFYLHFLALPFFVLMRKDIYNQILVLNAGPKTWVFNQAVPSAYIPILLNGFTQLFCIAGVHRLTGRVSSLSVTLTLAVRKATSLVISVALYGRSTSELWLGTFLVMVGTVLYSIGSTRRPPVKTKAA